MKYAQGFLFYLTLTTICLCILTGTAVAQNSSFKLFTNGTIYIDTKTTVKNLLVKDGTVQAYNVDPVKFKDAEIVDLAKGTAYPGFIDSHVHLMEAGTFFNIGVDLQNCNNVDAIALVLAKKAKTVPEGSILIGVGFSLKDYDKWSIEDLVKVDRATGNRPLFIVDYLGHNSIINSATMKLCNISKSTPVPYGGKIIIEDGKPTGMLRESAMSIPGNKIMSMIDNKDVKIGTEKMLKLWASIGYTSVVDLMGLPGCRLMKPEVFYDMEKEGILPVRVNYCYTIYNLDDVDDALKYVGKDTDMVKFYGCKIFIDGAFAGGQAWTSWKNQQNNHGLMEVSNNDQAGPQKNINRIIARAEDLGLNMHYHTQGDMAVEVVLDALDKVVAKKGSIKGKHVLAHVAFITDEQIARIKKFNGHVIVTVQPAFWEVEKGVDYYYGKHSNQSYQIKKLFKNEIPVGISTDFSVSPLAYAAPAAIMKVAETGGNKPAIHQPLEKKDIISGLSLGSSLATSMKDLGVLYRGCKADMVVYEKDFFSIEPDKLDKDFPRVMSTWIGGKKVYEANK
ncbi:MAG: amidohydrolase family protein [Candidatus Eremiobacteraeota bacterium]|nr:amidohydrolase family protein [Candidatus Eremiobacteraeota bacterium]